MEIMYLKGTDMVTLSGVRVFHVSPGRHSFLYFSADGKDYTSDGSVHVEEEEATDLQEAVANVMKHAPEISCGDGPYNSTICSNEFCDNDDLCHAIYKLKAAINKQ